MFEANLNQGDVRAVLLSDGWHECRSLDFEDGLISSTFEIIRDLTLNNDGDVKPHELIRMDCYRFADLDDVVYAGPLAAVQSLRIMPEALYLSHLESIAARELRNGSQN